MIYKYICLIYKFATGIGILLADSLIALQKIQFMYGSPDIFVVNKMGYTEDKREPRQTFGKLDVHHDLAVWQWLRKGWEAEEVRAYKNARTFLQYISIHKQAISCAMQLLVRRVIINPGTTSLILPLELMLLGLMRCSASAL